MSVMSVRWTQIRRFAEKAKAVNYYKCNLALEPNPVLEQWGKMKHGPHVP